MLSGMRAEQLVEYRAHLDCNGQGEQQDAAMIAAAVVNEVRGLRNAVEAFMGSKKPREPVKADDYVKRWRAGGTKSRGQRKHLTNAEAMAQARARVGV